MCPGTQLEKEWPQSSLGQTYLLVLEGLLGRRGTPVAHSGDKDTGGRVLGVSGGTKAPSHPIYPLGSSVGKPQATTGQKYSPTQHHTSKFSWTHTLWKALPTRGTRPSPTLQGAGTSPSNQEVCTSPSDQPHPPRGRHQKKEEVQSCRLWNRKQKVR